MGNVLRVCFVGLGSIGRRHLENLRTLGIQKNISIEIDAFRSRNNLLENSISDMLSNSVYRINDLNDYYDIIFITNPTYLHFDALKLLGDKSKHFFIEKPVFNTSNIDIKSLGLETDKIYYVACPLRYSKVLQTAKSFLKKHTVYSVRAISSSYLPDWRKGTDYRTTYSAHKSEGGGVSIDLIHEWDYLTDLFGFPLEIKCYDGKVSDLEIDSEDIAIYIGKYTDMLLELHLDYFGREAKRELEFFCQDGVYKFDILNGYIYKNGVLDKKIYETANDKYIRELDNFLNICFNKGKNNNDLFNALRVLTLIEQNRGNRNVK